MFRLLSPSRQPRPLLGLALGLVIGTNLLSAVCPRGPQTSAAKGALPNTAAPEGYSGAEQNAHRHSLTPKTATPIPDRSTQARAGEAYGKLPLSFEANLGQADSGIKFLARGRGYSLFLSSTEAVFSLSKRPDRKTPGDSPGPRRATAEQMTTPTSVVRMRLAGANPTPRIEGGGELPGKSNYFRGNDPQKWRSNIPNYARVEYGSVYPGVDLVYYGDGRQLEYDFVVAPGIDPGVIRLDFKGVRNTHIDAGGDLILRVAGGEIRQKKPVVYQEAGGGRRHVEGRYVLKGKHQVGFEIADYDREKPLTIDPVFIYSTYLGGAGEDIGYGIAVDTAGNAYLTGKTSSTDFPTANPAQPSSGGQSDVYVSKLNPSGTALVYSTYIGGTGSGGDHGYGIAVDASGNAYVTGYTRSNNFPVVNPLQPTNRGGTDAFVAKLNPAGSQLLYSTYLGGSDSATGIGDWGYAIAVDAAGNAYVTGDTTSNDFPTANPLQPTKGGRHDAFVSKLNATGTALIYSTYLGGSQSEHSGINNDFNSSKPGNRIAVDMAGNAYVTGYTFSTDFPTANPLQPTNRGQADAFVSKINAAGTALVYSTYLGGSGSGGDFAYGIAVDASGSAYVTGDTASADFPTTAGAFQRVKRNREDAFVTKLDAGGAALVYSTFLGGDGGDFTYGVAVDGAGNAYVTGETVSTGFPVENPLQPNLAGGKDGFVAKLNSAGTALVYSTYLGGSAGDSGSGIAVDAGDNTYITGWTISTDFPTTNPLHFDKGHQDAFVARIQDAAAFSVTAIVSNRGGNTGEVSTSILGGGFRPGANVVLRADNQPDIAGRNPKVADTSRMMATFDLSGATPGKRDVVVTLPGGAAATLRHGFTVEAGVGARLRVDIIGRDAIRAGRPQAFNVVYSNVGNTDAVGVPLWIGGIPSDADVDLGFEVTPPPLAEGQRPIDWSQVPVHLERDGEKVFPLFIPLVPAGQTRVLRLSLTVPTLREFRLRAWVNPPYFQSPMSPGTTDCYIALIGFGLNFLGLVPGVPDEKCARAISLAVASAFTNAVQFGRDLPTGDGSDIVQSLIQVKTGAVDNVISIGTCVDDAIPVVSTISSAVQIGLSLVEVSNKCRNSFVKTFEVLSPPIRVVASLDPNDKFGAWGAGPERYLSGGEPLPYAVYFENVPTATASAQEVVITDQLDLSKLESGMFSFGPIAFGDKQVVPPQGVTDFHTITDLRPSVNLQVKIRAHLDTDTGLLTWRFSSVDPATGLPPEDPLAGFLPPGGGGSVVFTVSPKSNLPTGTVIENAASIVFDNNAALQTSTWSNAIDNAAPASQVRAAAAPCSANLDVRWSGTDAGSGVGGYTVYVSVDGGPFTVWQSHTNATSATYAGQFGHTYAFYSVAQDKVGNVEGAHSGPDASVTPVAPAPPSFTSVPPSLTVYTDAGATACGAFVSDAALGAATVRSECSDAEVKRDGVPGGNIFPVGTTTITYTAADAVGQTTVAMQTITVIDKTPPSINGVSVTPSSIWPPNHKMAEVALAYNSQDNCGGPVTNTLDVSVNATGAKGKKEPDWEILDARRVLLRADKGNVYTINIISTDGLGNRAVKAVVVGVPHDQGRAK
jgi:hypothetical protein